MRSVRPKPRQELPEWAKQRIEKLQMDLELAEARIRALQSTVGKDPDPLLVDVANAFLLADFASESGQGQNLERVGSRSAEVPLPGSDTRAARIHRRRLRVTIERAVYSFNKAAERAWRTVEEPAEKVRCRNTSCEVEGKRIPRFVGPGNSIELIRCPKCDGKLSAA